MHKPVFTGMQKPQTSENPANLACRLGVQQPKSLRSPNPNNLTFHLQAGSAAVQAGELVGQAVTQYPLPAAGVVGSLVIPAAISNYNARSVAVCCSLLFQALLSHLDPQGSLCNHGAQGAWESHVFF